MPYVRQIVAEKANIINHNKKIYGTFAEIGAGQEVVNYFFKAGLASQTVAKSMSAYDMVFSDHIYGKAGRYVCEKRLTQMLEHEYSLLQNRLKKTKGPKNCFFAFSNTVSVQSLKYQKNAHGWMGLRFQSEPLQKNYDEILFHVNLKDRTRLQQYETLGALGVNLIHAAFYSKKEASYLIRSLVDNFEKDRVEIDVLKCTGPSFKHIKQAHLNEELLKQNLTHVLVFNPKIQTPLDAFYDKNLLLHLTTQNQKQAQKKFPSYRSFVVQQNQQKKSQPTSQNVILHNDLKLDKLASHIQKYTEKKIIMHIDFKTLNAFLKNSSYKNKTLLQVTGSLFDKKTTLYVPSLEKDFDKLSDFGKLLVQKKYILS